MTTESAGYWGRLFIDVASQLKTRSWAPASATPNEVCTRRWFSPTRCSCVPAKNAPATNAPTTTRAKIATRSEEHTSELQSRSDLVCRLLLEKKKKKQYHPLMTYTILTLVREHAWVLATD